MNEKKNIDKLFKEQLKNFEATPKDHVWEHIESKLHEDKREKRRIIPIWWKVAGIAAGLVLLFTVGNQVFNTTDEDGISKDIIVDESDTNRNDKNNIKDKNNTLEQNNSSKVISENDETDQVVNSDSKTSIDDEKSSINKNKSNVINSDNKINPVIASDNSNRNNSNRKNLIENTTNSVAKNSSNPKKSLKEKSNQTPLSKDAVANISKSSTNTKQNTQTIIKDKSEIDALLKSTKTETNSKGEVAKTSTETIQNKKNTIKDKSEIDALLKSAKTGTNTTVADVNTKEKGAIDKEKEDSVIENNSSDSALTKEEKEDDVNAIENAIAEAEDTDKDEEEEEELNRWSVSPMIAPVYSSSFGEGSPLDNQFIENKKEPEINMSYGINGSYAVNKKIKIRAGINKVKLGYKTNDILIFENTNPVASARRQIANVNLVDSMSKHSIYSARNFKFDNTPATLFIKEQGSLDQQLGFIEVPIEIEYNLTERKLGLNLIGGFSTLFLSENDVYAVLNNGDRTRLGEATNIKDLSYTANFGIGIDYNFSKQFQFSLDPTFKYQINTFNNTSGDFKPFFIGVYTGLSFKF